MKIQKLVMGHCLKSNVREDIGIAREFHSENTEVDDEPRSRKAILWWFNL